MQKIVLKGDKFIKKVMLLTAILSILCIGYFIYYGVKDSDNKAMIEKKAESILDTLKQDKGVQDIEVQFSCRKPLFIPSENKYVIFVDVIYDSIRKRSEDEWMKYLVGDGEIDYISANEQVFYTQAIKTTSGKHPIIITVSDDTQSYCLEKKYSSSNSIEDIEDLAISKSNAFERANISDGNSYKTISMILGIVFLSITSVFIYLYGKNRNEFRDAVTKFYAECQEKGISATDVQKLKEVGAFYAKNSGVTNFENVVSEIYLLGKNGFTKAGKKQSQKPKGKLIAVLAGVVGVAIIGGVVVYNRIIVPDKKYETAIAMKKDGDMESAYDIFLALGNYKDSKTQCDEYDYSKAVVYYSVGQFAKCYQALLKIEGYKPAIELSAKIKNEHPYVEILTSNVGDTVVLGEYEQDNDNSNGKEPIEWIVLGYEGDKMLLISKYILDAQPFNTTNSLECTLDDWITDHFFLEAFSNTKIDENILCAMLFFDGDQDLYFKDNDYEVTSATEYAKSISGFETGYTDEYCYWLAGDAFGDVSGKANASVGMESTVGNYCSDIQNINGVRPTLWICPGGEASFPATATYSGRVPVSWSSSHGGSSGGDCYTCNGRGAVKYYYGGSALEAWLDGHEDFEFGPCPSCHGSGKER